MDASRFHEYINDGETWIAPPFRTRIAIAIRFPRPILRTTSIVGIVMVLAAASPGA
jgi:hypothetical protein